MTTATPELVSESEAVMLAGGLTVLLPALALAWELETRGGVLEVEGDQLTIRNAREWMTPAYRQAITRWKVHLMAIVAYRAPERSDMGGV